MNYNPLTSRTNWTLVVMFAIQYGPVVSQLVPAQWKPLIDGVLTLLAFYFHVDGVNKMGRKAAGLTSV